MAKYTKELKSRLDIIKFYYQQYNFYMDNIGNKSEFDVVITEKLALTCFNRMLALMEKEWS